MVTIRRKRPRTTSKVTITLPVDLAEALREEARLRRVPSVSAFIARAVEEKLEHDRLSDVINEIFDGKPMTTAERAWADQYLIR